ncbi:aminoglycoside phosphotransferase family protein [Lentisalinibacter sediminis]|uniref:aminoglycoside phosphotransferase family protein n=1 Tax=Lentisalinibacter sediminis TaxID=2992237 RepID=UPI00386D5978
MTVDDLRPASADASFRRYFRVRSGGQSYVAMDAPPAREDSEPFLRIAGWLQAIGLTAPRVLHADLDAGFLLLTDLGDELYLHRLEAEPGEADRLYGAAIRALVRLQRGGARHVDELPPYDHAFLHTEMALFRDWLCQRHLGLDWSVADATAWREVTERLAANAVAQPAVFVHRDYHSRNLMVTAEPPGILDFQDAMHGPVTYDLVSLLKDCYITWPRQRVLAWVDVYRQEARAAGLRAGDEAGDEDGGFLRAFDLMGVQRHLKAAGIFARLWHRDGKPGYLADVPRTLAYVAELRADYPELEWLCALIAERVLPALPGRAP